MNSLQKVKSLFLLLFFTTALAWANPEAIIGPVAIERNLNMVTIPQNLFQVPEILISRDQYLISYNKNRRLLNWAAWKVEPQNLGHVGRSNNFLVDSDLENYLAQFSIHAVGPQDYQGSCFDRGHQCPSADRDDSTDNNQMTFLMSNMIPQTAYLNRVIWEHLEVYTRNLVNTQGKKVYIIAGPIFDQDFGKIGLNQDIPVPSKNFKVVIILDQNQSINNVTRSTPMIAVIMPNILKSGKRPFDDRVELCNNKNLNPSTPGVANDPNDWKQYQTTLEEVERMSGFKILN